MPRRNVRVTRWRQRIHPASVTKMGARFASTVEFVTLAGWILWRQRVTRTFLLGMFVAIAGMFVLVGPNFAAGGRPLAGDALGALTAVFYAGYFLAIKIAR